MWLVLPVYVLLHPREGEYVVMFGYRTLVARDVQGDQKGGDPLRTVLVELLYGVGP